MTQTPAIAEDLPSIEVARSEVVGGIGVLTAFVKAGLVASNGEARRQIKSGGLRVNDQPVTLDAAGKATYTPATPGGYRVRATATDFAGRTTSRTTDFAARHPGDEVAPVVAIVSPEIDSELKQPTPLIGTVTDADLQFLIDQLEEEDQSDDDYFIDQATIDLPEKNGASKSLVSMLRAAVGDGEGVEITWKK